MRLFFTDKIYVNFFTLTLLGDEQLMMKLIKDGANINLQDAPGWSPLCVAVWNRNMDAMIQNSVEN